MTTMRLGNKEDQMPVTGERIVVGFDGSRFSWEALRWAADEAGRLRGALDVVLCTGDLPETSALDGAAPSSLQALVDEATRVASRRGWQIRVNGVVASESPGDALVDRARGAAMLVLGKHDPLPAAPAARQSLNGYCLSYAPCPVMVVTSVSQPRH